MKNYKILIVTDAWYPQINGVVRTLEATLTCLKAMGHDVTVVGPDLTRWCTFSLPSYPSIKIELFSQSRLMALFHHWRPDFIHLATEGPLGWAARHLCLRLKLKFTTSFHTRFPEYLSVRMPRGFVHLSEFFFYRLLRQFHASSSAVLVPTNSIRRVLEHKKFKNCVIWSRGVDGKLFHPRALSPVVFDNLARPLLLYVGRVSVEKNLEDFLKALTPGTKVVVGEGPDLDRLKEKHPDCLFLGFREGEELAEVYAGADLFVFPSKTDTFGLVLIEALASGLRVASYPAPGPKDILDEKLTKEFAVCDKNLESAIQKALQLPSDPMKAVQYSERYNWQNCTEQFIHYLELAPNTIDRGEV